MKTEFPIRILHVVNIMDFGGTETMIMNIYRKVDRSKVQFDFAVHDKTPGKYDSEINNLGGNIYYFNKFNGKNYFSYKREWENFLTAHPELKIVHGHMSSSAFIYLKVAKKLNRLAIAHSHSVYAKGKFDIKELMHKMFTYPIRFVADDFFGASEEAGIDRFGKKVASQPNFWVIKNAIDLPLFKFSETNRADYRSKFNLANDDLVLGHVGRFTEAKNHKFLLEIFDQIKKEHNNAKLLLIGSGELENDIHAQVQKLKLEDSVIFGGNSKDIGGILSSMDIFVFPSIFEGLPLSTVESQSNGLITLVSEAVPQEAFVTPLIYGESLEQSAIEWTNKIDELLKLNTKRDSDFSDEITKHGFNIEESSQFLQQWYLDHLK